MVISASLPFRLATAGRLVGGDSSIAAMRRWTSVMRVSWSTIVSEVLDTHFSKPSHARSAFAALTLVS